MIIYVLYISYAYISYAYMYVCVLFVKYMIAFIFFKKKTLIMQIVDYAYSCSKS